MDTLFQSMLPQQNQAVAQPVQASPYASAGFGAQTAGLQSNWQSGNYLGAAQNLGGLFGGNQAAQPVYQQTTTTTTQPASGFGAFTNFLNPTSPAPTATAQQSSGFGGFTNFLNPTSSAQTASAQPASGFSGFTNFLNPNAQAGVQAGGIGGTLGAAQAGLSLNQNWQSGNYLGAAQNLGQLYQYQQASGQPMTVNGMVSTLQQAQQANALNNNMQSGNFLGMAQNAANMYGASQGQPVAPTGSLGQAQLGLQGYQSVQQGNYGQALSNFGQAYNLYSGQPTTVAGVAPQPAQQSGFGGFTNALQSGNYLQAFQGVSGQPAQPTAQTLQANPMQAGTGFLSSFQNQQYGNALVNAGALYGSYSGQPTTAYTQPGTATYSQTTTTTTTQPATNFGFGANTGAGAGLQQNWQSGNYLGALQNAGQYFQGGAATNATTPVATANTNAGFGTQWF